MLYKIITKNLAIQLMYFLKLNLRIFDNYEYKSTSSVRSPATYLFTKYGKYGLELSHIFREKNKKNQRLCMKHV